MTVNIPFVRNNIRYRSTAAKALEGFYNSKAFLLNESISSRNSCSETAKEVLLLMFNTYNEVLSFTENLLLDKAEVTQVDVDTIIAELQSEFEKICKIFDQHIDIFDSNFIRHWIKIHKQLLLNLYASVQAVVNHQPLLAFPIITESLIDYLGATLFELHELDSLLGSNIVKKRITTNQSYPDGLILYMDDATATYVEKTGVVPELERFLYYVETLIDAEKFEICIKDYSTTSNDVSGTTSASSALIKKLREYPQVSEVTLVKKST